MSAHDVLAKKKKEKAGYKKKNNKEARTHLNAKVHTTH